MDMKALISKAKTTGKDQTKSSGGANFELLPTGMACARLIGYYELGKHPEEFEGTPKQPSKVLLKFELSGGAYAPVDVDGKKIPRTLTVDFSLSSGKNSGYFALVTRVLGEGQTHLIELLGDSFLIDVVHSKCGKYANIDRKTIRRALSEQFDPATGTVTKQAIAVPAALSPLGAFVWDLATPEMWDSIYVPGEYEAKKDKEGNETSPARSKNQLQLKIASALNFASLPCHGYALAKLSGKHEEAAETKAAEEQIAKLTQVATPQRDGGSDEDPADPMGGI